MLQQAVGNTALLPVDFLESLDGMPGECKGVKRSAVSGSRAGSEQIQRGVCGSRLISALSRRVSYQAWCSVAVAWARTRRHSSRLISIPFEVCATRGAATECTPRVWKPREKEQVDLIMIAVWLW